MKQTTTINPKIFASHFSKRDSNSHKGKFGHVVIFAGSAGHLGAGYLSSLAALKSGCGLVTYCLPAKVFTKFDARYPEVMCDSVPDENTAAFHPKGLGEAVCIANTKTVAVIGPAIGTSKETKEFVNEFIKKIRIPVIIDADGLNVLNIDSIKSRKEPTILTPHPGEMSRIVKGEIAEIQSSRTSFALQLAEKSGAFVVLKGNKTVVATPTGDVSINPTGNAGMATAGMGDALTGIIAAFVAEGMDVKTSCEAAVYIHGLAGDIAVREISERSLITSDVINNISKALNEIQNS